MTKHINKNIEDQALGFAAKGGVSLKIVKGKPEQEKKVDKRATNVQKRE